MGKPITEVHPLPIGAPDEELRAEREARELEIINQNVAELNAEALDVLGYQAKVNFESRNNRSRKKKGRGGSVELPLRPET